MPCDKSGALGHSECYGSCSLLMLDIAAFCVLLSANYTLHSPSPKCSYSPLFDSMYTLLEEVVCVKSDNKLTWPLEHKELPNFIVSFVQTPCSSFSVFQEHLSWTPWSELVP